MEIKPKINEIVKKSSEYMPGKKEIFRAGISAIPFVGGSLDHLLFDKSESIRLEHLEKAFDAMSEAISDIKEEYIQKDWFESDEALAAIKILIDKIGYEPDTEKIKTIGKVVATFGLKNYCNDQLKLNILSRICDLTKNQIELLKIISNTNQRKRTINNGGLTVTASAIWATDILNTILKNHTCHVKTYIVDVEILASYNVIRRLNLPISDQEGGGYLMTETGKKAIVYLSETENKK